MAFLKKIFDEDGVDCILTPGEVQIKKIQETGLDVCTTPCSCLVDATG